ncbi:MAG: putative DNA binding domain-containing protein [Magnetococcales bacterium]|nr:putative DNA binding domain-containing protein [Magnetococcales bacterium]
MITLPKTLEDLSTLSETMDLECKSAQGRDGQGALPRDFWKTYSAFANTQGGLVLLGIKEEADGRFSPIGIKNIQKIRKDLFNNLNNPKQVSINLLTDDHVFVINLEGSQILAITIPRATRKQRPVYLNNQFIGNTYRRFNDGDHVCDEETVRRMLVEQIEDERDTRILIGYGIEDLTMTSFQTYRQMFSNHKPEHPWNEINHQDFLHRIGAWRKDRQSGESGLTLAGLLMFGQLPSIQEAVPHYFLDYQERPETNKALRWVDRLTLDGTWSGNLFDFYRVVFRKLIAELKIPFAVRNSQREGDSPVHIAIREALINTLVHADFTGRLSLMVIKRPDMFEFRNPGNMRIPIEQALIGGDSDCRNRLMHQMFLNIGLGERAGSGIPKIYSGWKSQHWRTPALYEKTEPEQTLLELRMLDLMPEGVMADLGKRFGEKFQQLGRLERTILALIKTEKTANHGRLVSIVADHPHDLTLSLQQLVRDGFLVSNGRGRGTIYHLPGEKFASADDVFSGNGIYSEHLTENSVHNRPDGSVHSGPESSVHSGPGSSVHSGPESSVHKTPTNVEQLDFPLIQRMEQLDSEHQNKLRALAFPVARSGRCKCELVKNTIISLCTEHYITLDVLSELLNRKKESLRIHYLNPMVTKERSLRRAFPTTPNHPSQAYTTAKTEARKIKKANNQLKTASKPP